MLSSSDPEGKCYITTANLDGETNLKVSYLCIHSCPKLYVCTHSPFFLGGGGVGGDGGYRNITIDYVCREFFAH